MRRRIVFTTVLLLLLLISAGAVFASNQEGHSETVVIESKYVDQINCRLSISKGTAKVITEVRDTDGDTTKLSCVATLQKRSASTWKKVTSWDKTTRSKSLTISQSKAVGKGKYRVKNVVKAYKENRYETITKYSNIVTY